MTEQFQERHYKIGQGVFSIVRQETQNVEMKLNGHSLNMCRHESRTDRL